MRTALISEVNDVKGRMGGYFALMNYKFCNLCTKAEPASLLPVDIYIDATRMDMEQVAIVGSPREDQLSIIPKDEHYLEPIIRGVFDAHPEFKLEIKYISEDLKREDERYLLYTMPEVNKDRRDLLTNAVKSLYEETSARIKVVFTKDKVNLIQGVQGLPVEEIKELEEALDEAYDQNKGMVDQAYELKRKEIEDAYERYLEDHPDEEWTPASISDPKPEQQEAPKNKPKASAPADESPKKKIDFDVTKGFVMGADE